jgi:CheY-like chemotaxis protein
VEAWRDHPFDLILMDTQMPVMDGLTAIRAIRALEAQAGGERTPIISLTADAMPAQVQEALAAGADRHLAKPVTAVELIGVLTSALVQKAA